MSDQHEMCDACAHPQEAHSEIEGGCVISWCQCRATFTPAIPCVRGGPPAPDAPTPRLFQRLYKHENLLRAARDRHGDVVWCEEEFEDGSNADDAPVGFSVFDGRILSRADWQPDDEEDEWPGGDCDEWWEGTFRQATAADLIAWGLLAAGTPQPTEKVEGVVRRVEEAAGAARQLAELAGSLARDLTNTETLARVRLRAVVPPPPDTATPHGREEAEVLVRLADSYNRGVGLVLDAEEVARLSDVVCRYAPTDGPPDTAAAPATARVHDLKVWPEFFDALLDGSKTFEARYDDRGFEVGDVLRLREWQPASNPGGNVYSGRELRREVSYVMHGGPGRFGVGTGYAILGLRAPAPATDAVAVLDEVAGWDIYRTSDEVVRHFVADVKAVLRAPATDDAPTEVLAALVKAARQILPAAERGGTTGLHTTYCCELREAIGNADAVLRRASPRATAPARNPMGEMPDGLTEADLIGGEF
jgi:hypothetical protein